jgi:hypothetical protein
MASADSLTPKAMSLLIENASGVTEYVIGVMNVNDNPVIGLLGARVASGRGSILDRQRLQEAIALQQWARTHLDVFEQGRVV